MKTNAIIKKAEKITNKKVNIYRFTYKFIYVCIGTENSGITKSSEQILTEINRNTRIYIVGIALHSQHIFIQKSKICRQQNIIIRGVVLLNCVH